MGSVKCIVWDLDDTLWDGTCLEDPGVTLKPGIREVLTGLRDRGILLSIASKNEPEALRFVDQFGLADLFLHPHVNWDSKDENIRRIAERLGIGLDTIAFVDDSPFEREGVASTLPGVRTYDSTHYLELLELEEMQLRYDTVEARQRSDMYVAEGRRQELAQEFEGRREEYLRSLEMVAVGRTAQRGDLPRIAELMARTNQFNSTGLRYSEAEVEAAWNDEAQQFCVISQRDRLGDNGRCGVALTRREGDTLHIEALMLSCRVAGRGVGTAFLCYLSQRAIQLGCQWMSARYVRTERNRQIGLLYKILGFVRDDEHSDETSSVFVYDLRKGPTALPDWLQLLSEETARHA
jgi:FkbH-like protein